MTTQPEWVLQLRQRALVLAGVGGVLAMVGIVTAGREQFFRSYLFSYVFWLGIPVGALGLQMIHALTGGRWGMPARRVLYAASSTLPLFVVLFVPIAIGMKSLYPWTLPDGLHGPLHHKAVYLNVPFFLARAFGVLLLWSALAMILYRRSLERGLSRPASGTMRVISGPGLLVLGLTVSVAAIDWLMSLDPAWFSTMFGVIILVGQLLSAMCFVIALVVLERKREDQPQPIDALHDLGNLLLVFVMLWAYVSYSQYLIIYAGNIAEETPWYVYRTAGAWRYVSQAVIAFHFVVPFMVLISRRSKRNPSILSKVAMGLLVVRLVEVFWITAPNFYREGLHVHWLDVVLPLALGGIWLTVFFHRFAARELRAASAV
jgi:hypothetical protein